jgi:hypothetical protein
MGSSRIGRVAVLRAGAALLISGGVAAGLIGIGHATIGRATVATATHSVPASVAVPAHAPKRPEGGERSEDGDCCPSEPPADAPPSNGEDSWYTFFQAFSNVPNNQERVVYCGRNYPNILSGWGLVIPTLAGQQVSSHAVYNPDGWAFSARSYFGRTVSFNVFATCTSRSRG